MQELRHFNRRLTAGPLDYLDPAYIHNINDSG
jgi:hypothetical protein